MYFLEPFQEIHVYNYARRKNEVNMITRKEEQGLLVIVRLEDNAYLVTVRQELKKITGKFQDVGSINKILKKLEQDGLLTSVLGDPIPVRGGRAIKYYKLTDRAWKKLEEINSLQKKFWKDIYVPAKNR